MPDDIVTEDGTGIVTEGGVQIVTDSLAPGEAVGELHCGIALDCALCADVLSSPSLAADAFVKPLPTQVRLHV